MPGIWITCPRCGASRDTSNRYTSPANQRRDHEAWERVHGRDGYCQRLRKAHECQIRTTTALDSPECAQPAYDLRGDVHLWVCPAHQYVGGSPPTRHPGGWPPDRRGMRVATGWR